MRASSPASVCLTGFMKSVVLFRSNPPRWARLVLPVVLSPLAYWLFLVFAFSSVTNFVVTLATVRSAKQVLEAAMNVFAFAAGERLFGSLPGVVEGLDLLLAGTVQLARDVEAAGPGLSSQQRRESERMARLCGSVVRVVAYHGVATAVLAVPAPIVQGGLVLRTWPPVGVVDGLPFYVVCLAQTGVIIAAALSLGMVMAVLAGGEVLLSCLLRVLAWRFHALPGGLGGGGGGGGGGGHPRGYPGHSGRKQLTSRGWEAVKAARRRYTLVLVDEGAEASHQRSQDSGPRAERPKGTTRSGACGDYEIDGATGGTEVRRLASLHRGLTDLCQALEQLASLFLPHVFWGSVCVGIMSSALVIVTGERQHLVLLFPGIMCVLLVCLLGEAVRAASHTVEESVAHCAWLEQTPPDRRVLLQILTRLQGHTGIRVLGAGTLSLDLFMRIMQKWYEYGRFLRNVIK